MAMVCIVCVTKLLEVTVVVISIVQSGIIQLHTNKIIKKNLLY